MPVDKEYFRQYHQKNRDSRRAASRKYVASMTPDQRERRLQKNREWWALNRESQRTKNKQRRESMTAEKKAERTRQRKEYYVANRVRIIAEVRQYNQQRPHARRAGSLKNNYGLTIADYDRLAAEQRNRCAICNSQVDTIPHKKLYVDHCHMTGVVRGLLCSACNFGLGKFKDSTINLRAAIEYLERARPQAENG